MSKENDWKAKYLNDTRTTKELITLALNEEDGDVRWELVVTLIHREAQEIFEVAKRLCEGDSPNERELGADFLGQLDNDNKLFHEESLSILFKILEKEIDADVLQSATVALGHLGDERAVGYLVKLKDHPDEDVRYGVVFGLLTHETQEAIDTLIELSNDEDEDVRNWATFGLGTQIDVDTPEIREALFQRLNEKGNDTCDDVRGEALVGLAKRKDKRVFEPLMKELEREDAGPLILEAAEEFADPRLLPALLRLKDLWAESDIYLENAIEACQNNSQ